MRELIKEEEILKKFTFHYDDINNYTDVFFCKCGHLIEKDRKVVATEMKISVQEGTDIADFTNLFDETSMARFALRCDNCGTDYSNRETSGMVQECEKQFFESYCFQESDNDVKLTKQRFLAKVDFKNTPHIILNETLSWIRFNKNDKKLYLKDFNKEEIEFNLDKVMVSVKIFFLAGDSKITERLFDIHLFIDRMANFVSDSQNINIIDELMSQMVGRSGLDIITKVTSIFFGIICYSNLSTIALTKGTIFLFDMMNDCKLPNPKELSDNGATSPLKIFNYLVNYKNEEISKELDTYDAEKLGYVYKAENGREMTFKYDASRFDNNQQTVHQSGERFLREDITEKSVSPYIFNTIERFSDYKILIKYTKFISYNELIELVKKNNTNLLINLWYGLEFRADMNINKINQIILLALSSLERKKLITSAKTISDLKFMREEFAVKEIEKSQELNETEIEKLPLDYTLLRNFDLTMYDDSLRMILALNWDPNKEFYKIKQIDELENYHNELLDHFNLLSNEAKNKEFIHFVLEFKVLEEYAGKLKIRLIRTPELLLKAAQDMKNCAGSYVNRVSNAQYLLCIVEDIDSDKEPQEPEKFMLGLTVDKYGKLEFDQVKATCNKQGSDRFKKNVMEFLQEKEISYKELADLRLSTSKRDDSETNFEHLLNHIMVREHNPMDDINNREAERLDHIIRVQEEIIPKFRDL